MRFGPRHALALLALLAACGAAMLTALGARDITHTMEGVALTTAQEAWLARAAGDPHAGLITYHDGRPRIQKPPLVAWLDWLAWTGLDPATDAPESLVWRARVVSVGMGLLTIACIAWIGTTLGDPRVGLVSALIAGSTIFLQRQARTASFDIHVTAWVTLAAAGGIWAMLATEGRRRVAIGWAACGLGTLGGLMSKNPLAAVFVLLPLASVFVLVPGRRRAQLVGFAAAFGGAAACTGAWYAIVLATFEGLDAALLHELRQPRTDPQPWYYYVGLIGLVAPWSVWLVAGLIHPWTRNVEGHRARALVPWLWLVAVVVVMSIPGAKQQRYILPALPAAALVAGFVWRDMQIAVERDRIDAGMRAAGTIHWLTLLLAGPVLALAVAAPERVGAIVARLGGGADGLDLAAVPPAAALAGGVALVGLAVTGWRLHRRWSLLPAAACSGAWALVALSLFWAAYGGASNGRAEARPLAAAFLDASDGACVGRLIEPGTHARPIDDDFRFYYQRAIPRLDRDEVAPFLDANAGAACILALDEDVDGVALLRSLGLERGAIHHLGAEDYWRLWCRAR